MDISRATVGRGGGGWSYRDVLSMLETLVGALLVISAVSWAEVMTLVPAPAHAHPGE